MTDTGFGDFLIKEGLLRPEVMKQALERQSLVGRRLDTVLLDMDVITETSLLDALGRFRHTATVSALTLGTIDADTPHMIPSRMAARYEIIPYLLDGKRLSVATLNPGDLLVEDELNFITGCVACFGVALEVRLYQALAKHYGVERTPLMISVCKRLASGAPTRRRRPKPRPAKEPFATPHDYIADAARQTGRPPDQVAREAGLDPSLLEAPPSSAEGATLEARATGPLPAPPSAPVGSAAGLQAPAPQESPPSRRTRRTRHEPTEVELSTDDLALFPSLGTEEELRAEAAGEPAALAPAEQSAPVEAPDAGAGAAAPGFEEVPEPPPPAGAAPAPQFEEVAEEAPSPQAESAEQFEEVTETLGPAAAEPEEGGEGAPPEDDFLREEDLQPKPVVELTPARRLAIASEALQNAEMREDIADALLHYCQPFMRRRMLLAMRGDSVIGWRGEGEGVDEAAVRAISIPVNQPSVFVGLTQGMTFWMAPLPPMPRNSELVLALGGPGPTDCLILPVTLRDRTICFLYGDNMDRSISGAPVADLRRLTAKASLAFQVYLLKNKIRVM